MTFCQFLYSSSPVHPHRSTTSINLYPAPCPFQDLLSCHKGCRGRRLGHGIRCLRIPTSQMERRVRRQTQPKVLTAIIGVSSEQSISGGGAGVLTPACVPLKGRTLQVRLPKGRPTGPPRRNAHKLSTRSPSRCQLSLLLVFFRTRRESLRRLVLPRSIDREQQVRRKCRVRQRNSATLRVRRLTPLTPLAASNFSSSSSGLTEQMFSFGR